MAQQSKETIEAEGFVLGRKEFYGVNDENHDLAPMTKGLIRVSSVTDTTVDLRILKIQE